MYSSLLTRRRDKQVSFIYFESRYKVIIFISFFIIINIMKLDAKRKM